MKTEELVGDEEFFAAAAERFAGFKYDVFDLFTHLTEKMQRVRWDSHEALAAWSGWADDAAAGRVSKRLNLYVHVPFCAEKCTYCMHFSGKSAGVLETESYLRALHDQVSFFAGALEGRVVRHMAVGGGTPSLLSAGQIESLLALLRSRYRFDPEGERSFECNPHSLDEEKLVVLRDGGVNRVSLGVQSLDARVLKAVGRGYQDEEKVFRLIRRANELGFARGVSVDLILGLVEDEAGSFAETFTRVADRAPETIFISALRPIPSYVRRHYVGDREAAYAHYRRMAEEAVGLVEEAARRRGYTCVGAPGREWIYVKESQLAHYAQEDGIYLAEQTSGPFSLLGLGWNARSHVWGRRSYFQKEPFGPAFDPGAALYEGAGLTDRDERLKALSLSEFQRRYGRDPREEFSGALRDLEDRGRMRVEGDTLRLETRDAREILLCGMRLAGRSAVERMYAALFAGNEVSSSEAPDVSRRGKNLELDVGMACNNRCVFCVSGDAKSAERRWLPLERAKEEIRAFHDGGCRSLGLLGGEPTAYPHILDSVRYARSLGYERVAVCTNGTKLSEPAFTDGLIEAGVTRFTISFHSHTPALEDKLTGLPGNFERKLKGLRHLLTHKAAGRLPDNVSLNPVLNRKTYLHLKEYIEFFRGEGVDDIRFNFIWPQARVEKDREMIPTYREAMKEIVRVVLLNESRWKMGLSFGGIPPCMLRWSGVKLSDM
ncbi:MAG: radical SAM protein, partial [Elusimicrobiota bacterium]